MKINYKHAEGLLQVREPFHANSLSAYHTTDGWYCVKSYNTIIAIDKFDDGGVWTTPAYYSQTTSRHLNIIRRAWGLK